MVCTEATGFQQGTEQTMGESCCPKCARPLVELGNLDPHLKIVTVKELVERCGGDFIDEISISGPIRHAEVFGDYTPERIRLRTINLFQSLGLPS